MYSFYLHNEDPALAGLESDELGAIRLPVIGLFLANAVWLGRAASACVAGARLCEAAARLETTRARTG